MRPHVPEITLSPEDRAVAVAHLLATALLRLHDRHALAGENPPAVCSEKTSEKRPELP